MMRYQVTEDNIEEIREEVKAIIADFEGNSAVPVLVENEVCGVLFTR